MSLRAHVKIAFVLFWCAWLLMALHDASASSNDFAGERPAALMIDLLLFGYLAATRRHRE